MLSKKLFTVLFLVFALLTLFLVACGPPPAQATPAVPTKKASATDLKSIDVVTSTTYLPTITATAGPSSTGSYTIVDTNQNNCFDNRDVIDCGSGFNGQDAQYAGVQPSYQDNGDGTITDLNTGLMWQKTPDLDNKISFDDAVAGAETFNLAGYDDWRLPTIKELYSLIDFNGSHFTEVPYIDTDYFDFRFGDTSAGERDIDAQYWSSTEYVGTTFNGDATVFGVNFADGRIKGYPKEGRGGATSQFVRYVRDNPDYGINDFVDNGDGTITDQATTLMWMKSDSNTTMNWSEALNYCENLDYANYSDWRLPNAKELQSIVDYSRAPDAQNTAQQAPAIDPIFDLTETESWFWTGTTLLESPSNIGTGSQGVYVTFGQAFGIYSDIWGNNELINVHGAGAQRSDPKSGDPADWSDGFGPQSDQIRIYNYVRCVRDGGAVAVSGLSISEAQSLASYQTTQLPAGRTPPPEAIDACSGASQGSSCQFTSPHREITGTCQIVADEQLVCVPSGPPPSERP